MTLQRQVLAEGAIGVAVADRAEDLGAIHRPDCAAAIWRRPWPEEDWRWIEGLDPSHLPSIREVVRPEEVREAAERAADQAEMPEGAERDRLLDDIAMLAEQFTRVISTPYLRLRLDVVTSNACRRFHIDAVDARLICTYRGTGTQYGISADGDDPAKVFTVPRGAPVLLKGTLWPGGYPSGLLHRSPPIEGTGETRLLLVLDPVHDLEEAV